MKKSIAVIRALDVRIIQAEYASHFRNFRGYFVANYNGEAERFLGAKKIIYKKVDITPAYLIDPLSVLLGRPNHQSWMILEKKGLENVLKDIDIYQLQESFFLYSGQVAGIAKKFNKPLVMAPWMLFDHPSTYIPPYCLSVRKSMEQTDLFILRTQMVENYLSKFKIPARKKVLIYHGVNTKRFYPRKEKHDEVVRLLFVGLLDRSKGIDDILDNFPRLVKASKAKIELVVCGKGKLEGRVRSLAKTLPIHYLGYVSNSDLPGVYRNADIFCGPSKVGYFLGIKLWEEGFGFVFIEAMASGLPIVSYKTGAIEEAVGKDNLLVQEGDKEGLLKSLIELTNDSKLRRDIGINNRSRAVNLFDLDKQIIAEEKEFSKRLI